METLGLIYKNKCLSYKYQNKDKRLIDAVLNPWLQSSFEAILKLNLKN